MSRGNLFRQGDLLFKRVDKIPNGIFPSRSNIILRGESTGHSHRIENGQVFNVFLGRRIIRRDEIFIRADKGARIIHEEHGILLLEPAFYVVTRQREFMTIKEKETWKFIRD